MPYAINKEALEEFKQFRAEKKFSGKIHPLEGLALTKAINILAQVPRHVQQKVVDKSIMNGYRGLFLPNNTLDYDDKPRGRPAAEQLPKTITAQVERAHRPIPREIKTRTEPEHEKEVKRNKDIARKHLDAMKAGITSKKDSDLDPFWQEQIKHEERKK